jgi:hypothetical protein
MGTRSGALLGFRLAQKVSCCETFFIDIFREANKSNRMDTMMTASADCRAERLLEMDNDIIRTIDDLPCAKCSDPRGADLRHALMQAGGIIDEKQYSPISGLPLDCCRIRSAASILYQKR